MTMEPQARKDDAPLRFKMVLLCAACCLLNYADRVNISVVILPMANEYGWTTADQASVMSAFFCGYLLMQFGGALLSRRFGAKRVLTIGALLWSAFTALTPLAADTNFAVLCLCRFMMGLSEGVAFPAVYHFLAGWIPPAERGRAVSTFLTGTHAGTTVALLISPHIAAQSSWRMVFWAFGAAGAFWIVAWHRIAYDKVAEIEKDEDPGGYKALPVREADLERSPGLTANTSGGTLPVVALEKPSAVSFWIAKVVSAPERKAVAFILGNATTLSVCFTQFSLNLCHYVVLSWLPTYFAHVYEVNLASLSFTAVPYLSMALCCNLGGWGADHLSARGMTLTRVRKIVTVVSCVGAALFYVLFSFAPTVKTGIVCVTLALCFQSLGTGGFESSYLDMSSPSLAGTFKSIANTLGAGSGVVAMPYTTSMLRLTGGSWRSVFGCLAFYHLAAMLVFCRYATSKRILVEEAPAAG
jgi:MFS transporter, ACS family, solute carrier family 17 (sodium-dependent inorganic phosphate cotransporter), other